MTGSTRRKVLPLLILIVIASLGIPLPLRSEGFSVHGSLTDRYRFRTTGFWNDNDMEMILSLDFGEAMTDQFTGALQVGGIFDLDDNDGGNSIASVYDTFRGRAAARVYYAWFDAKDLGPIRGLRAGRQHRYQFESLYFDGVSLESKKWHGLSLTAFGGVPVHLFENQFGIDPGDWLVGGALEWTPLGNFGTRLDYVHLRDDVLGFRATAGNHEDNLIGTTVWWDIDPRVGLQARFSTFSDQVRDVAFETSFRLPEHELSARFNFYRLLQGYDVRVIDFDAFGIAGTFQPYTEFGLSATKGFGNHFAMDGGLGIRFLDNPLIASAFNHGYERGYLTLSTFDLPWNGLFLSLTGDYYHGEDNALKNNTFALSFAANQDLLEKRLRLSGGTSYYLYRFNLFSGNESDDVRTFFLGIRGDILKNVEAGVKYEFENNDFNNFHSADVRVTWKF